MVCGCLLKLSLLFLISISGDISKAESLNSHLIRLGCRAEDEAVASMISWYAKGEKLDNAEAIFLKADSPSSGKLVFKCMIDAYAKSGRPEDAYSLYRTATEKGHNLGPVTISIIVNALTNGGMFFREVVLPCYHSEVSSKVEYLR